MNCEVTVGLWSEPHLISKFSIQSYSERATVRLVPLRPNNNCTYTLRLCDFLMIFISNPSWNRMENFFESTINCAEYTPSFVKCIKFSDRYLKQKNADFLWTKSVKFPMLYKPYESSLVLTSCRWYGCYSY